MPNTNPATMPATINLRASPPLKALARKSLIERAAAQVAQYPQYKDHFRPYMLGVIKRDIRTKMGLAFVAGETVIMRQAFGESSVTAWSMRNAIDTSIPASAVEVV